MVFDDVARCRTFPSISSSPKSSSTDGKLKPWNSCIVRHWNRLPFLSSCWLQRRKHCPNSLGKKSACRGRTGREVRYRETLESSSTRTSHCTWYRARLGTDSVRLTSLLGRRVTWRESDEYEWNICEIQGSLCEEHDFSRSDMSCSGLLEVCRLMFERAIKRSYAEPGWEAPHN